MQNAGLCARCTNAASQNEIKINEKEEKRMNTHIETKRVTTEPKN